MCRRNWMNISLICTLSVLLVLFGYMLAVVSFRQDIWIDYRSGARKTTCTLFPFSLSTDHATNAFWVLFGRTGDDRADWRWVESHYFVDPNVFLMRKVETITEAGTLVSAESRLVRYWLRQETDAQDRDKLSDSFYSGLRSGDVTAAIVYVDRLESDQLKKEMKEENRGEFRIPPPHRND